MDAPCTFPPYGKGDEGGYESRIVTPRAPLALRGGNVFVLLNTRMPARRSPQFSQESLRLISYCPVCDTSYNPMEARVIDERDDQHLMHIRCKKCAHSILALVLVSGTGVSSMGLLTDLTFDDVLKFRSAERITMDDVIAFHHFLEQEDGAAVLGKRSR